MVNGSGLEVRDERLKKKEQPLLLHYKISKINENILQKLFARHGLLKKPYIKTMKNKIIHSIEQLPRCDGCIVRLQTCRQR